MKQQTEYITEKARTVPVKRCADVIVVGGGLGGVAAALGSARAGAKTILIERNSFPGGTATAGMCCSIFNCFYTSRHELGSRGIALEITDALADATGYGKAWHNHKGHIIYDIEQGKYVLTKLLSDAGVDMLFNIYVSGVVKDGDRINGVIIESKSGREALTAPVIVDATGDSDVAALAGAPTKISEKGKHSICFRLGNVDVDRFIDFFRSNPDQYPEYMDVEWTLQEALAQYDECGTFLFPHGGGIQMDAFQKAIEQGDLPPQVGIQDTTDACQMHALKQTGIVHVVTGFVYFDGLDIDMITRSINDGRKMIFIVADVYKKYIPGFERAFVVGTGTNLGVRVSRYIDGDFEFTADMMKAGMQQSDVIGKAVGWDHPTRHHGKNAWGVQALREDSFDVPYRCLLPKGVEGLVMGAGRSVSTENPWLLRVMVHTMVVGQGAGVAAAVAAESGEPPRTISPEKIQEELKAQGALT